MFSTQVTMETTKFGCHSSKLNPQTSSPLSTITTNNPHLPLATPVSIATASTPPRPSNKPGLHTFHPPHSRNTWLPRKLLLPGRPTSNRTPSTSSFTPCRGLTWACPRKFRLPRKRPSNQKRTRRSSHGQLLRPNPPRPRVRALLSRSRLPSSRGMRCQGNQRKLPPQLLVGVTRLPPRRRIGEIKVLESILSLFT